MELTRIENLTPDTVAVTMLAPGISPPMLDGIHRALDLAESQPGNRVVVLSGQEGVFSTGMDFGALPGQQADGRPFFALMRRFTTVPRVVISVVDGQVAGGGVGLAAASDLVLATERSTFALPEALWGLLPCCVLPFLIRRIGFQAAYAMALSTAPVGAARAGALVDEVLSDLTPAPVRRLAYRLGKLDTDTIGQLKRYAAALVPIPTETEELAVTEFARLLDNSGVRGRLANFAEHGRYPWER